MPKMDGFEFCRQLRSQTSGKLIPFIFFSAKDELEDRIQGCTNEQISERLFISPRTVQTHLSNILNKLNLSNRTQLVRLAYEQGYEKV